MHIIKVINKQYKFDCNFAELTDLLQKALVSCNQQVYLLENDVNTDLPVIDENLDEKEIAKLQKKGLKVVNISGYSAHSNTFGVVVANPSISADEDLKKIGESDEETVNN